MNRQIPIHRASRERVGVRGYFHTKRARVRSKWLRAVGVAIAVVAGWAATVTPSAAHVKWFLQAGERSGLTGVARPDLFARWTPVNAVLLLLTVAVLSVLWLVSGRVSGHPRLAGLNRRLEPLHPWCPTLVGGLTGLMLVMNAFDGTYVALDLKLHEANAHWAAFPEALVGLALLLGWGTRFAALGLLVLFALAFGIFPAQDALDLAIVPGLAVYLLALGRGRLAIDNQWPPRMPSIDRLAARLAPIALPALRVFAGIAMLVLALDEKLLHPQYAMKLIEGRPWINFMAAGFHIPFPPDAFILCAGLVQLGLGICLVAGIFPRLCMAFLAGMFLTTFLAFGFEELYGHLPYIGGLFAILIQGSGGYELPSGLGYRTQAWLIRESEIPLLCPSA